MSEQQTFFSNLKCRECGRLSPKEAIHICEFDFGPLEAAYDYDLIARHISREIIASRPQTMWRYRELLPIDGEPTDDGPKVDVFRGDPPDTELGSRAIQEHGRLIDPIRQARLESPAQPCGEGGTRPGGGDSDGDRAATSH